jgi:predicted Zn-dependent protease
MPPRLVPDSFEYRLARAKLRAASGAATDAVAYFRNQLAERTVVRPREDVYGLVQALRRTRDFASAEKELTSIRSIGATHPAFERLAGQLQADQGRIDDALSLYRNALKTYPQYRGLVYGQADLLMQAGRNSDALAFLDERIRSTPDDARLYELQARANAALGRRLAQHRSQAEAYYRRGNLAAAVEQLEFAIKAKGSDFYELSIVEARLRQLRSLLENEREAEKALKIT